MKERPPSSPWPPERLFIGCFEPAGAPYILDPGKEFVTASGVTEYIPASTPRGEEQVGAGHRVVIEFDGGMPGLKLLHPEGGCTAPIQCGLCAADLTDPEAKRCYDCKDMAAEGCWLEGWFDNLDYDELLHGKVTLPIDAAWDGDHPVITVLQPATSTQQAVPSSPASDGQLRIELNASFARQRELLDAIDKHRDTLDEAAAGGPQPKHRDDVDNALYNAAETIRRESPLAVTAAPTSESKGASK